MATLNITIPDTMKSFVDSKVGPGRLPDASAYVQLLIAEDMETANLDFSPEEKERIDQLLLEAVDQIERGECAPWQPGEGRKILDEVIRRSQESGQP
jgi:Arc/MetJ-type ribon-helix-helix transcriptional regulator